MIWLNIYNVFVASERAMNQVVRGKDGAGIAVNPAAALPSSHLVSKEKTQN